MSAIINKIIIWHDKEYAHIIEDKPCDFCDLCAFSKLCYNVLSGKVSISDTPMEKCGELCNEEHTDYAFFIEADKAENYIKSMNDVSVL